MIATSQLPGRTVSVWLLLTHLSSSSSQTPMKTIQALCVSSPLNPWLPSQPTPTPPPHPTAKTLWSSTGRWVCTHTNTHTHMYIMYTLKALLHSTVRWVHSVYSVGRAKTRTSSSQVTQIHTVQQHLVAVYFSVADIRIVWFIFMFRTVDALCQWFSNRGSCTPGDTAAVARGYLQRLCCTYLY